MLCGITSEHQVLLGNKAFQILLRQPVEMSNTGKKRNTNNSEDSKGSFAKKRKRKLSGSDDDDSRGFLSPSWAEPPTSKIYNSHFRNNKPAELFRKDLISAMKLPDSEPLSPEDYWNISDSWKPEWESGVQVPVNPDALPKPGVSVFRKKDKNADFKLPKKLIHCSNDSLFSNDKYNFGPAGIQAGRLCRYDLDTLDFQWLNAINEERDYVGLPPLQESIMEYIMEELESQCYENLQEAIKTEEGLGIEYDEDVICDVCRSPDSEEGNEMVFCDSCNICVHQACYGITTIPEGSWICRTCAVGIRPSCILCPNRSGAMKSTRSGQKWAHVSCALWIPEVSIGCVEKMEPITKISQIPVSRWSLVCSLCKEKIGACIQCSVKTCKTAYHVTCAFRHGLQMKAIIDEGDDDDGIKLKSYCQKHSTHEEGRQSSESDCERQSRKHKDQSKKKELEMSSEDKANVRAQRIQERESEFYKYVSVNEVAETFEVDPEVVGFVFNYWKLKRKANFNKPLLPPRTEEGGPTDLEDDSIYARMKMFLHLRQDLERVRNLCYMVSRREKLSRSWYRVKEQIFLKQVAMVNDSSMNFSQDEMLAVLQAHHGDSVYDKVCTSGDQFPTSVLSLLSALMGIEYAKRELNGLLRSRKRAEKLTEKSKPQRLPNPYAKHYLNGLLKRSQRRSSSSTSSTIHEVDCGQGSPDGASDVSLQEKDNLRKEDNVASKVADMKIFTSNFRPIVESIKKEKEDDISDVRPLKEHVNNLPLKEENADNKSLHLISDRALLSGLHNFKDDGKLQDDKESPLSANFTAPCDDEENLSTNKQCKEEFNSKRKNLTPGRKKGCSRVGAKKKDNTAKQPREVQAQELKQKLEQNDSVKECIEKVIDSKVLHHTREGTENMALTKSRDVECQSDSKLTSIKTETVQNKCDKVSSRATLLSGKLDETTISESCDKNKQRLSLSSKQASSEKFPAQKTSVTVHRTSSPSFMKNRTSSPSGTSKSHVKSFPALRRPLSRESTGKEKLREQSAKLRESLFPINAAPRGCLSGYRIPKKPKTENEDSSLERQRGSSPVSPLSEFPPSHINTCSYSSTGYHNTRFPQTWQRGGHSTTLSRFATSEYQTQRLVIKLRKDPTDPDAQRWRSDSNMNEKKNNACRSQNDSRTPAMANDKNLSSEKTCVELQKYKISEDLNTENESKYSSRFRTLSQKV